MPTSRAAVGELTEVCMSRARMLLSLIGALALVAGVPARPAGAWWDDWDGRPDLDRGDRLAFYIWRDEDGVHLRTTSLGDVHRFHAILRTDGKFADVQGFRLEDNDDLQVGEEKRRIELNFTTIDGTDGVDLHVDENASRIRFLLEVDGQEAEPSWILIGPNGRHPNEVPFTIRF